MGKSKTKVKANLDDYRLKLIKEGLNKPLSYEKKRHQSYSMVEDFKRY